MVFASILDSLQDVSSLAFAALAEVPMTEWAQEEEDGASRRRRDEILPRPDPRRRRLSARRPASQYGEDCWQGVEQWQELAGRAH